MALSRYRRSVAENVAGNELHAAADAAAQVRNEAAGIVRANSFTLPKRQNRILWPLIFLHFFRVDLSGSMAAPSI
jgi:hypothetical protein